MARPEDRRRRREQVFENVDINDALRFTQEADEVARARGVHEDQIRERRRNLARRQAEEQKLGISGFSAACSEFAARLDREIVARALAIKDALERGTPVPSATLRISYKFRPKNPLLKKDVLHNPLKALKEVTQGAKTEPPAGLFNMLTNSIGLERIQVALDRYYNGDPAKGHNTRLSAQLAQGTKDPWTFYVSIDLAQAPHVLPSASFGPENRGDQLHGRAAFSEPNASGFGIFDETTSIISYANGKDSTDSDPLDTVLDSLHPQVREELLGLDARLDQARTERGQAEADLKTAQQGGVQREINEARVRYGAASAAFDTAERAYHTKLEEVLRPIRAGEEAARIRNALSGTAWLHNASARDSGTNVFSLDGMENFEDAFQPRVRTNEGDGAVNENKPNGYPYDRAAE